MEPEDFDKRVDAVRSVRSQRDAAEKAIPGERLRREIREAFERQEPATAPTSRRRATRVPAATPEPRTMSSGASPPPSELLQLEAEARYHRDRHALYRARVLTAHPTSLAVCASSSGSPRLPTRVCATPRAAGTSRMTT